MINRVIKTRAALLAFAAPLLFTAPALADDNRRSEATISVQNGNTSFSLSTDGRISASYGRYDNRRYRRDHHDRRRHDYHRRDNRHGYYLNEYGQSRDEVRYIERQAIRACRRAVRAEADYIGFHDVDFERRARTRQIGPRGFRVRFRKVEFEGHRRDFKRTVVCTVRGGSNVKHIEGMPRWGRRDYSHYSRSEWRTYDRRHDGHRHSRGDYCPADYGY